MVIKDMELPTVEVEFPEPIKITNFGMFANVYRNIGRIEVDKLFERASSLEYKVAGLEYKMDSSDQSLVDYINQLKDQIAELRHEAIQLWRSIISHAEKLK